MQGYNHPQPQPRPPASQHASSPPQFPTPTQEHHEPKLQSQDPSVGIDVVFALTCGRLRNVFVARAIRLSALSLAPIGPNVERRACWRRSKLGDTFVQISPMAFCACSFPVPYASGETIWIIRFTKSRCCGVRVSEPRNLVRCSRTSALCWAGANCLKAARLYSTGYSDNSSNVLGRDVPFVSAHS